MLHHYKHQLLHKHQFESHLRQVEQDRLVQLVGLNSSQPQTTIAVYTLIGKWWRNQRNVNQENRSAGGKIVMPKA